MPTQLAWRDDRKAAHGKAASSADKTRGLPLLMSTKRAAYELGVSVRTIYNLVADGTLELVKVGARMSRITSKSVRRAAGGRKN